MNTAADLPATTGSERAQPEDANSNDREVIDTGSVVHHKVSVKGSGGVSATVVVTMQQGQVWMSIHPPFIWEAIMEPRKVDELRRALAFAAESAKKMARADGRDLGRSRA